MSVLIKCTLLASVAWILAHGENLSAATIYADKTAYLAAAGTTNVATFEDVPVGQQFPFVSGGVGFNGIVVVENPAPVPYAFWFGTLGSPTHFAMMNPFLAFESTFPADANSSGFLFNCFACATLPNTTALDWTTLDANGNAVEQGTVTVNFAGPGEPPPGFFGLVTSKSFRSLRVSRRDFGYPGAFFNWMVDDVRYTAAAPALPPATIPTLNSAALLLSVLMLLLATCVYLRRAD